MFRALRARSRASESPHSVEHYLCLALIGKVDIGIPCDWTVRWQISYRGAGSMAGDCCSGYVRRVFISYAMMEDTS